MKLKTLDDIEETKEWDPTLDCLCHHTHARIIRREAADWIRAIRKCKVPAREASCIDQWDKASCANLLELFPGFKEPRIGDIDTMCFVLMTFLNITEEDLK